MSDSVETWMDELCRVFAVSDGERPIRSFLVFERNELPESITPEMTPCVVNYVPELQLEYSEGGPTLFYWYGQSDFHITRDVKVSNAPGIMRYFGRIVTAAAGHMKLNNRVEHFTILQGTAGSMQFVTYKHPVTGADDHQGIVVRWMVKQNVSGEYVVSA